MADRATLKTYFETGDKPTEQQFAELIDSMAHTDDVGEFASLTEAKAGTNNDKKMSPYLVKEAIDNNREIVRTGIETLGPYTTSVTVSIRKRAFFPAITGFIRSDYRLMVTASKRLSSGWTSPAGTLSVIPINLSAGDFFYQISYNTTGASGTNPIYIDLEWMITKK